MICYFTGTGNSLYIAQKLAQETGEALCSIAEVMAGASLPPAGSLTGIVYPVYAWAPPEIVLDFIRAHREQFNRDYVFSVCTCGENCGKTMRPIENALGAGLDYAHSIVMPSNFMLGMDVDTKEVEAQKLRDAEIEIVAAARSINDRSRGSVLIKGRFGGLKTAIVAPMFNRFGTSGRSFLADERCNGCKLCQKVCPTRNIRLENARPVWGRNCTACFACINHCPVRAIQWGKGTRDKGRYVNPNCRVCYDFPVQSDNPPMPDSENNCKK